MAVNPGFSKGKAWRKGRRDAGELPQFPGKPKGECWNCGEVGHFRYECSKPAKSSEKGKDMEEGAKKAGEANTMENDWDSDSEGAWAAEEIDGEIVASSRATPSWDCQICRPLACFRIWLNPLLRKAMGFSR